MKRRAALLLTTLPILLSACNDDYRPSNLNVVDGFPVILTAPFGNNSDDSNAITYVKVYLYNKDGTLAHFDNANHYSALGQKTFLTLTPQEKSIKVYFPFIGDWQLRNVGRLGMTGPFLTYGTNDYTPLTADKYFSDDPIPDVKIDLTLHALADPQALKLAPTPELPQVERGAALAARLSVLGPAVNGTRLPVPAADYTAQYQAAEGTLFTQDKLGASVKTSAQPSADFSLKANVQAWVATGEESAALKTLSASFTRPFAALAAPVITAPTITGVVDGHNYTGPVTPASSDAGITSVQLARDGTLVAAYALGTPVSLPGAYTLSVSRGTGATTIVAFSLTVPALLEENDARLSYTGAWNRNAHAPSHGGFDMYTAQAGASMKTTFRGAGVSVYGSRFDGAGQFDVFLDGSLVQTVDMYQATESAQSLFFSKDDLDADVTHTLELVNNGKKNARSNNTTDVIDYLQLR